jgi:hypothetical protein
MASYTIRVELKDPTEEVRTELLFRMLDNGFSRTVVCERGFTYALPTDEYVYVSNENTSILMKRLVSLLSSISENPVILITRSEERCWSRLRVVHLE